MAISKEQHDELCVTYATLVLFDGEAEVTSDAIATVIKASGNEVEPYWPTLFAGLLGKGNKILDLISSGGPGASSAAAAGGAAGAAGAAVEEEVVEEEAEEADIGGAADMFGAGGGGDY